MREREREKERERKSLLNFIGVEKSVVERENNLCIFFHSLSSFLLAPSKELSNSFVIKDTKDDDDDDFDDFDGAECESVQKSQRRYG